MATEKSSEEKLVDKLASGKTVTRGSLIAAAEIMQTYYKFKKKDKPDNVTAWDEDGAQLFFHQPSKLLVIPGTNELSDWWDFNLEMFNVVGASVGALRREMGASNRHRWHAGFLEHANGVHDMLDEADAVDDKKKRPKLIIGHSLGAASAQILGSTLGIPTIAFASPRPLFKRTRPKNRAVVLNVLRTDDLVCDVPPRFFGFHHVGHVVRMNPWGIHLGEDHRINHYIDALDDKAVVPKLEEALEGIQLISGAEVQR